MDNNMRTRLSAERFHKVERWARGLGVLVAGQAILFILDPVQTVMVWGFLGNVCSAILPHLVIGGGVICLALWFFTGLMRAVLLYLQDALDGYLGP